MLATFPMLLNMSFSDHAQTPTVRMLSPKSWKRYRTMYFVALHILNRSKEIAIHFMCMLHNNKSHNLNIKKKRRRWERWKIVHQGHMICLVATLLGSSKLKSSKQVNSCDNESSALFENYYSSQQKIQRMITSLFF